MEVLFLNSWLLLLLGTVVGWFLDFIAKTIIRIVKEKKEIKDNDYIDISGEWFVAWQTSINGEELLNTETLKVKQKGKTVVFENRERAPENPQGGYLWKSKMQFYQGRNLMGWYFPLKSENNSSKGIMYMAYFSQKRLFVGKWIGSGYDGELQAGFVVIATTREIAANKLNELKALHPNNINIISYNV